MSSSNNKWELAVSVPIKNQYFRYQNRFSAKILSISSTSITLSGATSGSPLQTDSDTSISHASEVMAANDRITLKAADGTVSGTTIASVNSSGLDIVTNGDMDARGFAAADTIVGYGDVVPAGWYFTNFDTTGHGITISRSTGAFDNFSLVSAISTGVTRDLYLKQSIDTNYYIANLWYRVGFKYKCIKPSGEGDFLYAGIENNITNHKYLVRGVLQKATTWASSTNSLRIGTAQVTSFGIFFEQYHDFLKLIVPTAETDIYYDEVYLEHVYNPVSSKTIYGNSVDDSDEDDSIGYYEIASCADEGSISWKEIEQDSEVELINKGMEWYDPTGYGERNTKYEVSAKFTNVTTDIWDKLIALKRIQKNGYKLNLHPYLDELPSVLTGKMYIEGVDYTYWDSGYVSFTFKFREF